MFTEIGTESARETFALGEKLAGNARAGQVYTLSGDLGAGKTVFAKGFAKGLGVKEEVVSPTFTIFMPYLGGRLPLYHFDAYRVGDVGEMDEIGYEDYIYGDGVSLIEWPERIESVLPAERICVTIGRKPERGLDYRRITIGDGKV